MTIAYTRFSPAKTSKRPVYLLLASLAVLATACSASGQHGTGTPQPTHAQATPARAASQTPTKRPPANSTATTDPTAIADLILVGAQPSSASPTAAPSETMASTGAHVAPKLADELRRGCTRSDRGLPQPKEGQPAIEFSLLGVDGQRYTLSELLQEKPVVLVFGSFT